MEDILREKTDKYNEKNPILEEIQDKEVTKEDIDNWVKKFKWMKAHIMKRNNVNNRRYNNQRSNVLKNNNTRKSQFN